MNIQVLGTGCKTCQTLHERVLEAVKELGIEANVEYITDIQKIVELGFMHSPILVVEGKDPVVGSVPSIEEIKQLLSV